MKKLSIIGVLAMLMMLCVSLVAAVPVSAATTWYVDDDTCPSTGNGTAGNPFCSIQDAIDAASDGDTIDVAAGLYDEYLYMNKDGLTIQGAGIDQSVIDLDGLIPYWHYAMLTSSFSARGGVSIDGYQNTGGETDLIENVTFKGFTVKNAGVNPPVMTGTHDGADDAANLSDSSATWPTPDGLLGQWVISTSDYTDTSGGRQFFRAQITANTATSLTATYISGGDEKDWDTGDGYVITEYREWYDGALDGREDVRGIRIVSGKNIVIQDCKVINSGDRGIGSSRSRFSPRKPSEDITITGCTISDNHDCGIGIGSTTGTATITHNTVSNNNNPVTEGCTYSGIGPPDCHITGMHIGGMSASLTLSGTISDNTVSGNAYHGITIYKYTDGFTVENNEVTGHNLNWEGAGIFLSTGWGFTKHCRNHIVRDNTVTGNIRGIIAYFAWDSTIEDNTVTTDSGTFDPGQAAIKIDHAYNLQVNENTVSCDGVGIRVTSSDSHDNTFCSNLINGAQFAGIYITSGAYDNTFTCNKITGTTSDTFTQYADWGAHDGGDDQATLTDSTQSWGNDTLVGFTVINLTDDSEGTITANDATTVTAVLSGGDNDWDTGDDYDIVFDETQADGVLLRGGSCKDVLHAGTGNVFHSNDIYNNDGDGMENQVTTMIVDAEDNWWGDATGPEDLSGTNEVPPCTDDPTTEVNADGLGDEVSDNVDYCPWEGSSSVQLEANICAIVSISVSPNSIDYGIIVPPFVQVDTLTVTNEGTVDVTVTHEVTGDTLFTTCLTVLAVSEDIPVECSDTFDATLDVPSSYSATGVETGQIIFWAEAN